VNARVRYIEGDMTPTERAEWEAQFETVPPALTAEEKDAFLAPWRQLQHVQARKHLTKVESRPKPSRHIDVDEPQVDREPVGHDNQPHAVIDPLLRG
jgi:hypothetical protein